MAIKKSTANLPRDYSGVPAQVFTPDKIVTISAAGDVDVSDYKIVMFDAAVTVYFNSASADKFDFPAYLPLGLCDRVLTINVSAPCGMMVM